MTGRANNMASLTMSAAIVAALFALSASTAHAVISMARANDRVVDTRELASQLRSVRDAVADEAFAEAAYLRAPSDERWRRLEATITEVPRLVAPLRATLSRTDAVTLSHLTVLNQRYGAQILSTRDVPTTDRTDDRVAGPALDAMQTLLDSLLLKHRRAITAATTDQADIIRRLAFQLPAVFIIAFGVLAWAGRNSGQERRRLRHQSERHRAQAMTDSLTGLPNRAYLQQAMRNVERDSVGAVLFLDLDEFKPVNDTFGHDAGDAILREVADRLRKVVRSDDIAARLGGDEFVVYLRNGNEAEVIAERILAAFASPFHLRDQTAITMSTSIGIAMADASNADTSAILRSADAAMYLAKGAGRGRVVTAS